LGRRAAFLILILLAVASVTHAWWMTGLADFLIRADAPQPADAALVLAGDETGARILRGAELVKQGFVPKVLVSGPPLYGIHECDVAIDYAVRQGYPKQWFVPLPHDGLSTREEADLLLAEVRRMQIRRMLLVTSNFHTRRAGKLFRSAAKDVEIRVVAAPNRFFEPRSWWHSRQGLKYFFFEWSKTVASGVGL
jgi:uncharacterized SAM-binding protein YcdF (DUF218 family)